MTPSTLRELSRAASPAPWTDNHEGRTDTGCRYVCIHDAHGSEVVGGEWDYTTPEDHALLVALRNDAEKYADLREAGRALAARLHEMYLGAETREKLAVFVAALDALDGSAP